MRGSRTGEEDGPGSRSSFVWGIEPDAAGHYDGNSAKQKRIWMSLGLPYSPLMVDMDKSRMAQKALVRSISFSTGDYAL